MKQLAFIGAFLTLAFPIPGFVQSLDSGPALWAVQSESGIVYLFGRMGVRADTEWLSPKIEEAFDASDVLWLENPADDPERGNELIAEHGFQEGYFVLDLLDEPDRLRMVALLGRAGMSPDRFEHRRAWVSYLLVTNVIDRLNGIASTPDSFFRNRADATGKEIRSEWPDIQGLVRFSAALPDTTHLQLIRKALDDSDSYEESLEAWLRGDMETLTKWRADFATKYPEAYRLINSERNARWAELVQEMLAQGATQFISVGIGHLVGSDSILTRLESAGFTVERL